MSELKTLEDCKAYFAKDSFVHLLGFEIVEFAPGLAKVSVNISDNMLNGAGVTHGGLLFTLADFTGAVVTNAYGFVCLSTNSYISYYKKSGYGATLVATANEVVRSRKISNVNIDIHDEHSNLVANARMTYYITDNEI